MTRNTKHPGVFPLPLSLLEKYFFLDTSSDYPMELVGKIVLSGNLDKKHFEQAVNNALESHPLFLRTIEKKWGRLFWSNTVEPFAVTWSDRTACDLSYPQGSGSLQLLVEKDEDRATIHYRCHHARCDGIGLLRFFGDIFAAYAALQGEAMAETCAIEWQRIVERDQFQEGELPEKLCVFRIFWENVKGIVQWLSVRPLCLGRRRFDIQNDEPNFGRTTFCIPACANSKLRRYAKQHSVTLNDLAVTLFSMAVAKWQRDLFASSEDEPIRFNIPVNMRWDGCETIPASNIISYAFLTRKIRDCLLGRRVLLSHIHEEMQTIKDWHVGFVFLDALAFFNRFPGGLKRMVQSKKCLASLVFSNVGVIDRSLAHTFRQSPEHKLLFGNLCLESLEVFAPCRRMTHLSIVMATLAEQIMLCCHFDRRYISDDQISLLLEYYDREQTLLFDEVV